MKKIRYFESADRYVFDFDLCSYDKGFSQIDTDQDAWYFGTWCNPYTLIIISYTEGDIVKTECENEEEFKKELKDIKEWNVNNGCIFKGIDPGLNLDNINKFKKMGLEELLH